MAETPANLPKNDDPSTYPALGRMLMWTDSRKNVDRFLIGFGVLCAGLFLADFLYHKHVKLSVEEMPGSYAIYGFVMCAALAIVSRGVRVLLKRDENFYAPYDVDAESYPEDQLERINHND